MNGPISNLAYLANLFGINNLRSMMQLGVMSTGFIALSIMKWKDGIKIKELEDMQKVNLKVKTQKEYLLNKDFNLREEERKAEIVKEFNDNEVKRKERTNEALKVADLTANTVDYKGLRPPNRHSMLMGYNYKYEPIWCEDYNIIVTGVPGSGKSRLLHVLILNLLANRQGDIYLIDLKRTDYKLYKGIPAIKSYICELERVKEALEAFRAEYERRIALVEAGYTDENGILREYIDIADYNDKNPNDIQKDFFLIIDEFADISDKFTNKQGPFGVYADIIQMARTYRAMGGRIILGTQRPSCDVIIGTLKNNTNLCGLKTLNERNSIIVIDEPGCEKLEKRQALMHLNMELVKIFTYNLSNEQIVEYTDRLKGIRK